MKNSEKGVMVPELNGYAVASYAAAVRSAILGMQSPAPFGRQDRDHQDMLLRR